MEMLFVTDSDLVFNACDWTVCVNIYSTLQLDSLLEYQCTTLNIFKDCHLGYLNLKIYSPIKLCRGRIFQRYCKKSEVSIAMRATRF